MKRREWSRNVVWVVGGLMVIGLIQPTIGNHTTGTADHDECRDANSKCLEWAVSEQCWLNPSFMVEVCPASCWSCPTIHDCQDKENASECRELAANGECRENKVLMKEKCFRSCGYCREADILELRRRLETTTKPFAGWACRNYHPECERWALEGKCWLHPSYMVDVCPVSCRTCPLVYGCSDDIKYKYQCARWVAFGECSDDRVWMRKNCFRSCGFCRQANLTRAQGNQNSITRRSKRHAFLLDVRSGNNYEGNAHVVLQVGSTNACNILQENKMLRYMLTVFAWITVGTVMVA